MTITLTNPFIQFVLNPEVNTWSLVGNRHSSPFVEEARIQISYRRGGRNYTLEQWETDYVSRHEIPASPHGPIQQLTLTTRKNKHGCALTLTFALPEKYPFLLWKVQVTNQGPRPITLRRIDMLRAGPPPRHPLLPDPAPIGLRYSSPLPHQGTIRPHPNIGELAFFSNGWQSWSYVGTYYAHHRSRHSPLGFLRHPTLTNLTSPRPRDRGHFTSEMFAILSDRTHRSGIVMGFLSQKQHFGTIEAWLHPLHSAIHMWASGDNIRLNPEMETTTDWAYLSFIHPEEVRPLDGYLKAVAREHHLPPRAQQPPTGWCSWYQYYDHLTAEDLSRNLHLASAFRSEIPLKVFQLDDGYQAQVGDWLETAPHFRKDLGLLAREIAESGLTPGLWLAPFILHRKSRVAKEHPDWLLRNAWGIPVSPGYVFDTFPTALDVTHSAALEYVQEVVHTAVHKRGFPYLKLDYLYAAALPGSPRDPSKTRAQTLRQGLEAIRQAAGDETFLLACGCPLGSAIGLMDAMRIGPDVSERWQPYDSRVPQFIFKRDPGAPAIANALRNTLSRAALHNRWWINDPDCILLRPDTLLSPAELQSWVTAVFLSGGSMILSDNLEHLTPDRKHLAQSLLPPLGLTPQVIDLLDSPLPKRVRLDLENQSGKWHLLAYFNWEDIDQDIQIHVEDYHLPEIEYLARDYWRQHISQISAGQLTLNAIPAHGVALLALRPFRPDQPQYIGSNLHLSQGWEVSQWKPSTEGLTLQLKRPGHSTGHFELYLPRPARKALCNGSPLSWENKDRIYRFAISFFQTADIQIIT